jgi:hypothetical protein
MVELCKIGERVYENCDYIKALLRTKSLKRRRKILKKSTGSQLLTLVEICMNVLRNQFKLTTRQKRRMLPYSNFIRQLGRVRSEQGARKLLIRKGSAAPIQLFPAVFTPIIKTLNKNGK